MRKLIFLWPVILLFGFAACQSEANKDTADLLPLVPSKTAVIIESKDLVGLAQSLEENSFINANQDLPIFEFFKSIYAPLNTLEITDNSLLTFGKIGRDEIATTLITSSIPQLNDSIGYQKKESFTYNGHSIDEYQTNDKTVYTAKLNDLYVLGDSKLVIENMVRLSNEKFEPSEALKKAFASTSDKKNSVLINTPEFKKLHAQLFPNKISDYLNKFTNWTALDLDIKQDKLSFNGITMPKNNELLGLFKQTKPNQNKLAKITPSGAKGFLSFTYDDFDAVKDNLSFMRKDDYPDINTDLVESAIEIGEIYNNETVLALRTEDQGATMEILNKEQETKTYRGYKIYSFSKPDYFYEALQPLVKNIDYNFYSEIKGFFVFAQQESELESIISNVQNESVLTDKESYEHIEHSLDDKSSLLLVGISKNVLNQISKEVRSTFSAAYKQADLDEYNYSALQFIKHKNFTYINGVFPKSTGSPESKGGTQIERIKPGEDIVAGPWFFENWRTKQQDIAFQGKSNTLYVYDRTGNLRWKKQLDGRILGDINPIDIYQNTRIQMAFTTAHTFYIIDREGNIVKPFNKTFKDKITQPLAVFDYNNNGRFRFIITQKDELLMYDKQLNIVKGFECTQTDSPVRHTPKHYRMGNKDYIVIDEESGKLNILNPRGQTRIKVDEPIDFSDNEWYAHQSKFISTNKKGQFVQIDQNGSVEKEDTKLGKDHKIVADANNLVNFSENKLEANGETKSLDYGLYTEPKIFNVKDKTYISITDQQAHKVYLFDSSLNLIPGFPVYGNSAIDLKDMTNQDELHVLVKGEEDSILIYEVE